MDDLVQWLGEQLDIDTGHAQEAAAVLGGHWSAQSLQSGRRKPRHYVGASTEARISHSNSEILNGSEAVVRHATVHDPARALREIEAKRQILALHRPVQQRSTGSGGGTVMDCHICNHFPAQYPCATVRLLAMPYADRPGYHEEWRP